MQLVPTKTVDSILASFTKTVKQLKAAVEHNNSTIVATEQQIDDLTAKVDGLAQDNGRAQRAIEALEKIVGPTE